MQLTSRNRLVNTKPLRNGTSCFNMDWFIVLSIHTHTHSYLSVQSIHSALKMMRFLLFGHRFPSCHLCTPQQSNSPLTGTGLPQQRALQTDGSTDLAQTFPVTSLLKPYLPPSPPSNPWDHKLSQYSHEDTVDLQGLPWPGGQARTHEGSHCSAPTFRLPRN